MGIDDAKITSAKGPYPYLTQLAREALLNVEVEGITEYDLVSTAVLISGGRYWDCRCDSTWKGRLAQMLDLNIGTEYELVSGTSIDVGGNRRDILKMFPDPSLFDAAKVFAEANHPEELPAVILGARWGMHALSLFEINTVFAPGNYRETFARFKQAPVNQMAAAAMHFERAGQEAGHDALTGLVTHIRRLYTKFPAQSVDRYRSLAERLRQGWEKPKMVG